MTKRPEHELLANQISKYFSVLINLISTISKHGMKSGKSPDQSDHLHFKARDERMYTPDQTEQVIFTPKHEHVSDMTEQFNSKARHEVMTIPEKPELSKMEH